MKKTLLGIALSAVFSTAFAVMPDFAGTYHCVGFDPYLNAAYAGTLTVTP